MNEEAGDFDGRRAKYRPRAHFTWSEASVADCVVYGQAMPGLHFCVGGRRLHAVAVVF